jgi:hypothetical protein
VGSSICAKAGEATATASQTDPRILDTDGSILGSETAAVKRRIRVVY